MADNKVSEKTEITSMPSNPTFGQLYLVRKAAGIWEGTRITLHNFFKTITANTSIVGTLKVHHTFTANSISVFNANSTFSGSRTRIVALDANTVVITNKMTPANSTISISGGRFFYDNSYLYIATANNTIKRVALGTF